MGAREEKQSPALGESFSAKEAETGIRDNRSLTQTQKNSGAQGPSQEHRPGTGTGGSPKHLSRCRGGCQAGGLGSFLSAWLSVQS